MVKSKSKIIDDFKEKKMNSSDLICSSVEQVNTYGNQIKGKLTSSKMK